MEPTETTPPAAPPPKTGMPKIGCLLMTLGFGGVVVLMQVIQSLSRQRGSPGLRFVLVTMFEGCRALMLTGLIVIVIGLVKRSREPKS